MGQSARRRSGWHKMGSWPLPVAVLTSIAVGLLLAVGLIEVFSELAYGTWKPWTRAARVEVPDLVKLALTIVAGIGATQALVVGYRRQRDSERDTAGQRDQLRIWTERFGAAAAQLGGDHAAVRLAGVYAMAALADEWEGQQQQCIDVLCGYLRLPVASALLESPGEREVRVTILKVLGEHLRQGSTVNWIGRDFDLTGAVLAGGDLSRAQFVGGRVRFVDVEMVGGRLSFDGALFSGRSSTSAENHVSFRGTVITGGEVSFVGASFTRDSQISFKRLTIRGTARVTFDGAVFSEGRVTFDQAQFSGGEMTFTKTLFTGSKVTFDGSSFSSGRVTFDGAAFDGEVSLDGEEFRGWPPPALSDSVQGTLR